MEKKVSFAEGTKEYDGCSLNMLEVYKVLSGYFNIPFLNVKKIGISQETIDGLSIKNYRSMILTIRIKGKILEKEPILPIKSYKDCISVCKNRKILYECLNNLNKSIDALNTKVEHMIQPELDIQEDEYTIQNANDIDDEEKLLRLQWEKRCNEIYCAKRFCCLDRKSKVKKNNSTSLIRKGTRDYNLVVNNNHTENIKKLINIIKKSIKVMESSEIIDFFKDFERLLVL